MAASGDACATDEPEAGGDYRHGGRKPERDRDGFVLGEGAWMFLLEELEHARTRGANVLAEVAGYASTCDAYHRIQIDPEIEEPIRAIEMAMADAGVAKDEVGYVNLHGTGTELNDRMETAVMKKCFGDRAARIPGSSTKSMIGHPQGAGGTHGGGDVQLHRVRVEEQRAGREASEVIHARRQFIRESARIHANDGRG